MSDPRIHVLLKDGYLYHDHSRLHVRGRPPVALEPADRALLECVTRAESEIGLLATALAEHEIGGDPADHAAAIEQAHGGPESIFDLVEPLADVATPQVIVCTFNRLEARAYGVPLVKALRADGLDVVGLGYEKSLASDDPSIDVSTERFGEATDGRSTFQFLQWCRSWIRFHSKAVLVMTGTQDRILFGDLAHRNPSVVCLSSLWPPAVRIQDLLGSEALLDDPVEGLRALFLAAGGLHIKDYDRLVEGGASELDALALHAIQGADLFAFTSADQPNELRQLGLADEAMAPMLVPRIASDVPNPPSGEVALLFDDSSIEALSHLIVPLRRVARDLGFRDLCIRSGTHWLRVEESESGFRVDAQGNDDDDPAIAAAIAFPGHMRGMAGALDLVAANVPMVLCSTKLEHPILADGDEGWSVRPSDAHDWTMLMSDLFDAGSELRERALASASARKQTWNLSRRIRQLVDGTYGARQKSPTDDGD